MILDFISALVSLAALGGLLIFVISIQLSPFIFLFLAIRALFSIGCRPER